MINKTLHQPKTPVFIGGIQDGLVIPTSPSDGVSTSVTIENDYFSNVAQGNIAGQSSVNKFGRSTNVDDGVITDIWDRANATNDQDIWIAPTVARVHNITSNNAADDGTLPSTGARTIEVFGLTSWDTAEVSEVITMEGLTNRPTSNAYVIIHRMKVLSAGANAPNVGTIIATAVTDGTVTAQINPMEGQTQMAIYGIPSTQIAYITQFYASVLRANLAVQETHIDVRLLFNPNPEINADLYLIKHSIGVGSRGANPFYHPYQPYNKFNGPGILKMQAAASANNTDVSAGFDLILIDN